MLVDTIDPQTETGSISSDSDPQLDSTPASMMEDSDEEYEIWEGFSSGAYLSLQLIGANLH